MATVLKPQKLYQYEFWTSSLSLGGGGGQSVQIVVHVVNHGSINENVEVFIHLAGEGGGLQVIANTGSQEIPPNVLWSNEWATPNAGEYYVRVLTTSEFLIPKVSLERVQDLDRIPLDTYHPGDFAIFQLVPTRKRIW